jgi:hypothetical protein
MEAAAYFRMIDIDRNPAHPAIMAALMAEGMLSPKTLFIAELFVSSLNRRPTSSFKWPQFCTSVTL